MKKTNKNKASKIKRHEKTSRSSLTPLNSLPNRFVQGEICFSKNLMVKPTSSNLGSNIKSAFTELEKGNPQRAFDICRGLLASNPQNSQALNIAGLASFRVGLLDDAIDLLQTAIFYSPDFVEVQINLGNIYSYLERFEEASESYQQAIEIDANNISAFYNYGILLNRIENYEEAIKAFEEVIDLDKNDFLAWHSLGNTYRSLERFEDANRAYEIALNLNPMSAESWVNLGAVLNELGDFKGAILRLQKALEIDSHLTIAKYNLAIAFQERNKFKKANKLYEEILNSDPQNAAAAMNLAFSLQKMGNPKDALTAFERVIEIDPNFSKAYVNLADVKLELGDPLGALSVCDGFLSQHPSNPDLLAFKTIVLRELGENKKAKKLMNFERFLHISKLKIPNGYGSAFNFNKVLKKHIKSHPTLTKSPQSHATREGFHSGELLTDSNGPIRELEKALRLHYDNYLASLDVDDHPFLRSVPKKIKLSIWGVVMEENGFQLPHLHPSSWLSGVYYVQTAKSIQGQSRKSGWIAFGSPPKHFNCNHKFKSKYVEPYEGLLLLFPSFFYHHTIPAVGDGERISIAFDFIRTD